MRPTMTPAVHSHAADEPLLGPPVTSLRSDLSSSSFHEELLKLWMDPEIWRLALHRAGDRDLAEDALQETFYSVARTKAPSHIENLRGYFCRALINEVRHLRGQLRPVPVEDPEMLTRPQQLGIRLHASDAARPVDEAAVWLQLAATWRKRFRRERRRLMAMVPERSSDPRRYREVIVAAAAKILHAAGDGHVNWADSDMALRTAYPDWFDEPGCTRDTYYQRLSRARREVRVLLQAVVGRDEL
jgi:DNA-directed RNA polymerase specialized sigma24 family protein